jgi:DNA-nicking Smr family endonuclease
LEPVKIPINGELDLHTFRPNEVKGLLNDYIDACMKKKIYSLRVIHGKGSGILKQKVHSVLRKNPHVDSFIDAPAEAGGWGATLVSLKRRNAGP